MSIENEAFIDLENILHDRVNKLWNQKWIELQKQITTHINAGEWQQARKLTDEINFNEIVEELTQLARTAAEASLFLGASRLVEPEDASFFGAPDEMLIERGVEQWAVVLTRNATEALRIQAKNMLADLERIYAERETSQIIKADPKLSNVGKAGTQFSRATASLMISRMSTAGFMLEASHRGITTYRVNEVMDGATCPVCAEMHNKHFPVADGAAQSAAIMTATDPESLRNIAPFPSQSKANVKAIQNMGQTQLIQGGMHLPPYHPNCRGIVTLEDKNSRGSLNEGQLGLAAGSRIVSADALTPDELSAQMFGDFADLDNGFLDAILGVGVGAAFSSGDDDDDE